MNEHSVIRNEDEIPSGVQRIIHERFTVIAGILPFIADKSMRCKMTALSAEQHGVSRRTVCNYLWLYLAYQDTSVLAPNRGRSKKELTGDEKNIRWALNKFYYTKNRNSLRTAYTLMLKERYCDEGGNLLPEYPSFHQFRYFYRKHKSLQDYYISREGMRQYQRNHRPLLGDGVQEYAYIEKHAESYERYWAREVVWAARSLIKEERLTYINVQNMINIDRNQFARSLPFIKDYGGEKLGCIIYELIRK